MCLLQNYFQTSYKKINVAQTSYTYNKDTQYVYKVYLRNEITVKYFNYINLMNIVLHGRPFTKLFLYFVVVYSII